MNANESFEILRAAVPLLDRLEEVGIYQRRTQVEWDALQPVLDLINLATARTLDLAGVTTEHILYLKARLFYYDTSRFALRPGEEDFNQFSPPTP